MLTETYQNVDDVDDAVIKKQLFNLGQQLFLPSFKGIMKSTNIKAVMQTQFETCVTAFIALGFKLRQEKLSKWDLRKFPCSKAIFLMTVVSNW